MVSECLPRVVLLTRVMFPKLLSPPFLFLLIQGDDEEHKDHDENHDHDHDGDNDET